MSVVTVQLWQRGSFRNPSWRSCLSVEFSQTPETLIFKRVRLKFVTRLLLRCSSSQVTMAEYRATGSCLCGGVKFEITQRPRVAFNCHCSMCRKATGASFATFINVAYPDGFRYISSETQRSYESSPGNQRHFCGQCGCSTVGLSSFDPLGIWINAGMMDGQLGIPIKCHFYVGSKAPWMEIHDGLPVSQESELWEEMFKIESNATKQSENSDCSEDKDNRSSEDKE